MACRFACFKNLFIRNSLLKNFNYRNGIKHIATSTSSHSKSDNVTYKLPPVGRLLNSDLKSLGSKGFLRSLKEYWPPADVHDRVVEICAEFLNLKEARGQRVERTPLTDRMLRFKIFTKCIKQFNHDISNSQLYTINTIGDLITYFSIPVHTTTSFDDLKTADNLPPNLHIQHEYLRFHPDTDTKFGGVSAFPGSSTIITGLKARKKYKGYKADFSPFDQV